MPIIPTSSPASTRWPASTMRKAGLPKPDRSTRYLAAAEKIYGPAHANVAAALDNLAAAEHLLGNLPEAETLYKRVLAIREKLENGKPIDLAPTLHNLGASMSTSRSTPRPSRS